jgi:hypothetical protein
LPLHIPQDKNDAVLVRQFLNGIVQLRPQFLVHHGIERSVAPRGDRLRRGSAGILLVLIVRFADPDAGQLQLRLAVLHLAVVDDDAVQPRGELGFAVELAELAVHVDERILPRLFGFFPVAADFEREAVHEVLVLLHELRECAVVARLRVSDERKIVGMSGMCSGFQILIRIERWLLEFLEFIQCQYKLLLCCSQERDINLHAVAGRHFLREKVHQMLLDRNPIRHVVLIKKHLRCKE